MPAPTVSRLERAAFVALYAGLVVIATGYAVEKHRGLGYHTRDYPFYLQFQIKLADANLTDRYSLNPRGYNLLAYQGSEGEQGFHSTIHFEPIKYVQAALYALTSSLTVGFAFIAAVFFLPVLYLALLARPTTSAERWLYRLCALIYGLNAWSLNVVAYDLRPYSFLLSFFTLAVLAVCFRRSRLEVVLLFNLVFLAREEALVLLAPLLFYLVAAREADAPGDREADAPDALGAYARRLLPALATSYALWLVVIVLFMRWTGLPHRASMPIRVLAIALFPVIGSVAVVVGPRLLRRFGLRLSRPLRTALAFAVVLPPLFVPEALGLRPTHPRYALHLVCILLALIAAWPWLGARRMLSRATLIGLGLALGGLAAANLGPSPYAAAQQLRTHRAVAPNAELVFAARSRLDRLKTHVLVDLATYAAFADFEHVYVFERLPWYLAPGDERYLPQSAPIIRRLLSSKIDVVVIAQGSLDAVRTEATEAGVSLSARTINERFLELRVIR